MPFSISRCIPTCSEVDCYTRRIAPYTLTPCCKSFTESVEVFLKEACIISEFGPAWASGQHYSFCCCSAAALCFGRRGKEAGRQEGLEHKCTGVQDWNRENRGFYSNQHSPAFVCEILRCLRLSVEQRCRGNNGTIIFWPKVANSGIFLENCCYLLKIGPHLKQLDCCTLLCSWQVVTSGHSKFRCLGNPVMYLLLRSYTSQRYPSLLLAVVWIGSLKKS